MALLQESLEKAQAFVPPPTRSDSNDVPAALLQLDKIRAASTAVMAYLTIPDRKETAPRKALAKAHTIASQGMEFVKQVADKQKKQRGKSDDVVTLQDVWTKTLDLERGETTTHTGSDDPSPTKKPKLSHLPPNTANSNYPIVIKSRVLLTPNRKTPSNLLPALKRKRAKLIRPKPDGRGSHLILEFGKAFTMTIYFTPLLVAIRAMVSEKDAASLSPDTITTRPLGCASWTPLYHGLANKTSVSSNENDNTSNELQVWGVSGPYPAIGHVVEERLRDASTHATHVLRKCFRNHVKDKTLEFEVEILEASALLEFLQLARTTFIPNWQDDEV